MNRRLKEKWTSSGFRLFLVLSGDWFAGYFPFRRPHYAGVENDERLSSSSAKHRSGVRVFLT